jgi:tetratricopeptide (TPR) repeat protein
MPIHRSSLLLLILVSFYATPSIADQLNIRCAPATANAKAVMVGRFKSAYKSGALVPDPLEPLIQHGVAATLNANGRTVPTIWDVEQSDDSTLKLLIQAVFARGTEPGATSDRINASLSHELRQRGCDYLVGGDLNIGAGFTIVSPYLFDVARGTVEVPFKPLATAREDGIVDLGMEFGTRLAEELSHRSKPGNLSEFTWLVGCFLIDGTDGKAGLALAQHLTTEVSAELSGDQNYSFGVRPAGSKCEPIGEANKAVLLTGNVLAGETALSLRPRFEFGSRRLTLDKRDTRPSASDELTRQYLSEVKTFIFAAALPGFVDALFRDEDSQDSVSDLEVIADDLGAMLIEGDTAVSYATEKVGKSLAKTYLALSRKTDDPVISALSHMIFGTVLQAAARSQGGRPESVSYSLLAIDQLNHSLAISRKVPPRTEAQRDEALGMLYARLGAHEAAVYFLEDAFTHYKSQTLVDAQARVRKEIGHIRVSVGDLKHARSEFEAVPNLTNDFEALASLGDVSLKLGELAGANGAERWYNDALKLAPESSIVRTKLSQVYGGLAGRSGQVADQEKYYRLALALEEDAGYHYNLGLIEYNKGAYTQAVQEYRTIVDAKSTDLQSYRWVEAAWLNLLEAEMLAGELPDAIRDSGRAADLVFNGNPGSRLLAMYLRVVAEALKETTGDVSLLYQSHNYQAVIDEMNNLGSAPTEAVKFGGEPPRSIGLKWDNAKLSSYYHERLSANPARSAALDSLAKLIGIKSSK